MEVMLPKYTVHALFFWIQLFVQYNRRKVLKFYHFV